MWFPANNCINGNASDRWDLANLLPRVKDAPCPVTQRDKQTSRVDGKPVVISGLLTYERAWEGI
jgi:hypothetical protein